MRLEWDPEKATSNLKRHGVAFWEVAAVFEDPLASTWYDEAHSWSEPREITIGLSALDRLIVVYHVRRGDAVRIIGARTPTRKERHAYEDR